MGRTSNHTKSRLQNFETFRANKKKKVQEETDVDQEEYETVIADVDDTWNELVAEEEEEILDLEFANEEEVEQILISEIKEDERSWREKGYNSNVRGAGTSESTYKRIRQKQKKLKEAAIKHSRDIKQFFEIGDDEYINNLIYANYSDLSDNISHRKSHFIPTTSELDAAIQSLQTNEANITKNEKVDKRNKITHWNFLVSLCVLKYLQEVRKGNNKMPSSQKVANFVSI